MTPSVSSFRQHVAVPSVPVVDNTCPSQRVSDAARRSVLIKVVHCSLLMDLLCSTDRLVPSRFAYFMTVSSVLSASRATVFPVSKNKPLIACMGGWCLIDELVSLDGRQRLIQSLKSRC